MGGSMSSGLKGSDLVRVGAELPLDRKSRGTRPLGETGMPMRVQRNVFAWTWSVAVTISWRCGDHD